MNLFKEHMPIVADIIGIILFFVGWPFFASYFATGAGANAWWLIGAYLLLTMGVTQIIKLKSSATSDELPWLRSIYAKWGFGSVTALFLLLAIGDLFGYLDRMPNLNTMGIELYLIFSPILVITYCGIYILTLITPLDEVRSLGSFGEFFGLLSIHVMMLISAVYLHSININIVLILAILLLCYVYPRLLAWVKRPNTLHFASFGVAILALLAQSFL